MFLCLPGSDQHTHTMLTQQVRQAHAHTHTHSEQPGCQAYAVCSDSVHYTTGHHTMPNLQIGPRATMAPRRKPRWSRVGVDVLGLPRYHTLTSTTVPLLSLSLSVCATGTRPTVSALFFLFYPPRKLEPTARSTQLAPGPTKSLPGPAPCSTYVAVPRSQVPSPQHPSPIARRPFPSAPKPPPAPSTFSRK